MFHTFAGLPLSCAAATKVLQILREESLLERARTVGADLKQRLIETLGQHPNVAEIRGEGLLIGLEIVSNRDTLEQFAEDVNLTGKIVGHSMGEGVFFYPGGTGVARDIICIGAPLIIGEQEIDKITKTLASALDHCIP
jgi:hypothetical protein